MKLWQGMGAGCAAMIIYPLAAPAVAIYKSSVKIGTTMMKNPIKSTAAMALAGVLWYNGCYTHNIQSLHQEAQLKVQEIRLERKASELEEKLESLEKRERRQVDKNRLDELRLRYQERIDALDERIAKAETIKEPDFYYYFVKPDESLSKIAKKVTGEPENYKVIALDNGIRNPNRIMIGEMLRMRKDICDEDLSGLYKQVPVLERIVVGPGEELSEIFGDEASEVMHINLQLGLDYTSPGDMSRVVWYRYK